MPVMDIIALAVRAGGESLVGRMLADALMEIVASPVPPASAPRIGVFVVTDNDADPAAFNTPINSAAPAVTEMVVDPEPDIFSSPVAVAVISSVVLAVRMGEVSSSGSNVPDKSAIEIVAAPLDGRPLVPVAAPSTVMA